MSRLYFTQQDLVKRFGEDSTLGDVFRQIETELKEAQEVVCQFRVNGLALNEESEKRLASSQMKEVESLEVFGQEPTTILKDILESWSTQIPAMIQQNDQLAGQVRFQGMEGQLKYLVDLIDQCQLLVESIMSIDTVFPDFPIVGSKRWQEGQRQMAQAIGEALEAFQKKDFTWLADILEYDTGHSLQVWMELLEGLKADLKLESPGKWEQSDLENRGLDDPSLEDLEPESLKQDVEQTEREAKRDAKRDST